MVAHARFAIVRWEEAVALDEPGTKIVRTTIGKTFEGDLTGTAHGEMTMCHAGSTQAYLGYDRLDVVLGGRKGTFVVRHDAWRNATTGAASWEIVAGSGTGALEGIAGTMRIQRHDDGSHTLDLDYALP